MDYIGIKMSSSLSEQQEQSESASKSKSTREKIENTQTEELILGICYPIGSNSDCVVQALDTRLKEYNYEVEIIKISDLIKEYYKVNQSHKEGETNAFRDLMHKIEGGDYLRSEYQNNSILAELAIKKIREDREGKRSEEIQGKRKCYIINSLKNLEELKLLRSIYGDIFYLFSIFSPEKDRKENLRKKNLANNEINNIINIDEHENKNNGQNVRDTFVGGDFFIRVSEENELNLVKHIEKYIHLIFETEIITPNTHETAMYHAKSSAGNSACLSRQVGATITDEQGVVIAQGWNDVPKFGGNLYQYSDESPNRCVDLEYCSNVKHRVSILDEIENEVEKVIGGKGLKIAGTTSENTKKIMEVITNSKFKNIIEYSRSIHAEMHAIIIGSQMTGNKMVKGNLYCTTYPCHNCARHIILAGIKNIYYIEPYKKSLGITLHSDALTEDEKDEKKVRILAYDGVAPRRYLDFFSMKYDRKSDNGKMLVKDITKAFPKTRVSLQAIPTLENQAIKVLYDCGIIKKEVDDEE